MHFTSFSLKKPLPWISVVVGLVFASFFPGYGFSLVILASVLVLSTLFFNSSKLQQKPKTTDETVEERTVSTEDVSSEKMEDGFSDGACPGRCSTSEDSEAENIFRDNSDDEDGSISDEDSLIEIALPSGVYIDQKFKEEEKKKKLGDDLEFLKQQISLAELLAEFNDFNEEENLIEIDLSIGSIKCAPRFEIPA